DGVVGLLVVAWLFIRRRPGTAGMLLSLVVIARVEIAFFALALAAYAACTPGYRRFLVMAPIVPAIYLLAGGLYHGDMLWAYHYPSFPWSNQMVEPAVRAQYGGDLKDLITTVLALTPVVGVVAWVTVRGLAPLESTLCVTAIAFVAAIRGFPFTELIYVDASP